TSKYWLLKVEPDSRVVKGKDVKFSVDDFQTIGTSPWEGVRNYEARNLMKEMKEGDKALFYHSNCKVLGVSAFAKVSKETYPDCKFMIILYFIRYPDMVPSAQTQHGMRKLY
ncbi:PUA-like domain-containing protein, partial [Pholiota molesta]